MASILNRLEAISKGLNRYFTGVACKRGHVAERQTYDHKCVECRKQDVKKYQRSNPEKIKTLMDDYYAENKHKWVGYVAKRNAVKLNATPKWLSEDDLDVINWVYEMRDERSKATGIEHHVDHIVPLQGDTVCGLHVWWNLQLLPAYLNLSKKNKLEVNYGFNS
jgi:5-methylcytosine-specific restriction endonuclease McrA